MFFACARGQLLADLSSLPIGQSVLTSCVCIEFFATSQMSDLRAQFTKKKKGKICRTGKCFLPHGFCRLPGSPQNPKYIYFLLPVVLAICLDCFGVISRISSNITELNGTLLVVLRPLHQRLFPGIFTWLSEIIRAPCCEQSS